METKNRDVDVVEEFRVILDGIVAREEDDNFLLDFLLQEGEQ